MSGGAPSSVSMKFLELSLTQDIFGIRFEWQDIPTFGRDLKAAKFANLTQCNMAVAQDDAKFVELSKYAGLQLIDNAYRKAKKFE